MLEADSHAKVQMRRKVRGLRDVERGILESRAKQGLPATKAKPEEPESVVLEYCAAIRGILNKNQGGPLEPPGLRMATSLMEVRASIERSLASGLTNDIDRALHRLNDCIDRGITLVAETLERIPHYVDIVRDMRDMLDPKTGATRVRRRRFERLQQRLETSTDDIEREMAGVMRRFEPGLFVGGPNVQVLQDNLDLERWFKLPKAHERHIHGHQHAGIRIVVEGPSLLLVLDAHAKHRRPFKEEELHPYLGVELSPEQLEAVERRKIMRRASSRQSLPGLLDELEQRLRSPSTQRPARRSRKRSHEIGGS
jgi:hypothetical protein